MKSYPANVGDIRRGFGEHREMRAKKLWKYDGHQAFRRIKIAVLEREGVDADQHGVKGLAAQAAGVRESTWGMWKRRGAPISKLPEVAMHLDVDIYYLLGKSNDIGRFGSGEANPERENFADVLETLADRIDRLEKAS